MAEGVEGEKEVLEGEEVVVMDELRCLTWCTHDARSFVELDILALVRPPRCDTGEESVTIQKSLSVGHQTQNFLSGPSRSKSPTHQRFRKYCRTQSERPFVPPEAEVHNKN